jgi:hypothetical protein
MFPGLGPDGPKKGHSVTPQDLCNYLLRDFPGARAFDALDLMARVRRALLMLEEAGLVYPISLQRTPFWALTELGQSTLASGTVEQRLQKFL